jgi:hypothetical protein
MTGIGLTYFTLVKKCAHDWEKIYDGSYIILYRCKKCGKVQKIKVK